MLITLGIIGVVAALTIPTLISNFQKKSYVSGLQKGISTLSQTFKLMLAKEGVDYLSQTSVFKAINEECEGYTCMCGDQSEFVAKLGEYMNIVDSCHNPTIDEPEEGCNNPVYTDLQGDDGGGLYTKAGSVKIYTADGMVYYLRLNKLFEPCSSSSQKEYPISCNIIGHIDFDVNGDKEPNVMGRDFFSVVLLNDGQIILPGTKYWADEDKNHWSTSEVVELCGYSSSNFGAYCAARVFEEGWRMDY